ncbi:eukaryotic translation initiation factor 4E1-like [Bradysia coprophila]|uniref:eukaryotic translation initiation factor 4E1-like n=1 Tax=Bradysia coprophila TaxID=38358 RepID=UPI00187DD511|nr:eukaryotic translation initiation factor 4E1-like [Bradysia coprophila]
MVSIPRSGSSRSIDMNPEGRKIAVDRYIKHPLQDQWTLWFLQYERNKSWEDLQNRVITFDTVEDFWSLYDHIKDASVLGDLNDYSVFKGDIRPMWEDAANKRGGRWVLNAFRQRHELDNLWLSTLLYMIGGTSKYASYINGAVVNVRSRGDKIAIWVGDCHDTAILNGIGLELKNYLRTNARIVYEEHNSSKGSKPLLQL